MNRIKDLFGSSTSSSITKNKDAVVSFLHLDDLKKVQLLADKYAFKFGEKKYIISNVNDKTYDISDGTNSVNITSYGDNANLAEAIASHLVKYGEKIYKVMTNNHPGFESTNLYYFNLEGIDPTNLLDLLTYLNNNENKLYRSFKMSFRNFLKLSVTPDSLTFENPKIITSLEVNIGALIERLVDEDKSELRTYGEFINGVFLDNRSQSVYEAIKNKKSIDKISALVIDDKIRIIEGLARLAVLNTLGYDTIEALIYGDIRSLITH